MLEEQWSVGLVGLSPATAGVRIAKTNMGNVPARQFNSPDAKTPAVSHPATFFWKRQGCAAPQEQTCETRYTCILLNSI